MLIFGHDCGCDGRREYMAANPRAFLLLAGLAVLLVLVAWKGVPHGGGA